MIFEAELTAARGKAAEFVLAIEHFRRSREKIAGVREEYSAYLEQFERRLAVAQRTGASFAVATNPGTDPVAVYPHQHQRIGWIRRNWSHCLVRLDRALARIDRKLAHLQERAFLLDYWILEKEEAWSRLDPDKLRSDLRQIVLAAEELSKFLLGRSVEIAFDTRENAPLGHVPIHPDPKTGRKVYLSSTLLEEQSAHLTDHYRALIVHELGHLLLHLKNDDYRRLRRLMRKHITLAPGFFDVFNILLDQQLERVLRDTRPEWQGWFNRLDFHARRIPLRELRDLLVKSGQVNPEATIADLAARRLIKVYADADRPFATIQSAAIFSEGLGFTRLYGFYAVFANKLPLASIQEAWLRRCLEAIPKNFKSLTVFEVHALAVEIYRILLNGAEFSLVEVEFERTGKGLPVTLAIPGTWASERGPLQVGRDASRPTRKKRVRGTVTDDPDIAQQNRDRAVTPPPNPEGEPPPPQIHREPEPVLVPRPALQLEVKRKRRRSGIHPVTVAPRKRKNLRQKQTWHVPRSPANVPQRKPNQSRKSTSRPRFSQNRAKAAARQRAQSIPARPVMTPRRPLPPAPPPSLRPPEPLRPPPTDEASRAEQLATAPVPSWSPSAALTQHLDRIVAEIRAELAGKIPVVPLARVLPEGGKPSEQRNETDVRAFPPLENVHQLKPNLQGNADLLRRVRPFVTVLRPYLAVLDAEKIPHDRLMVGRRLLASGLMRHLAYGETRLFADQRFAETDLHREVFVAVLIDTSASMQTDNRLVRAQRLGVLLAECLRECPQVESVFLGYNQNVLRCGTHDEHALASLAPAGKTNEAAALDYLRANYLGTPRRRKIVVVLSDGLPTDCSVESVRWLVRALEKDQGARFLYGALSATEHPAYRRRADLTGELTPGSLRALGKKLASLLG